MDEAENRDSNSQSMEPESISGENHRLSAEHAEGHGKGKKRKLDSQNFNPHHPKRHARFCNIRDAASFQQLKATFPDKLETEKEPYTYLNGFMTYKSVGSRNNVEYHIPMTSNGSSWTDSVNVRHRRICQLCFMKVFGITEGILKKCRNSRKGRCQRQKRGVHN